MEHYFKEKILPAVTIENKSKAVPVARAIRKGGLGVMEIPFRSKNAVSAIKKIKKDVANLYVGAGTILSVEQIKVAKDIGADFGLAPGFNPKVLEEAIKNNFPFVPGVMTPSEIELAFELGCTIQKLFPISQMGGLKMLKALHGPYAHTGIQFIPMGGVSLRNMTDFLANENVIAVGGSWLATKQLIANEDYNAIAKNVEMALKKSEI